MKTTSESVNQRKRLSVLCPPVICTFLLLTLRPAPCALSQVPQGFNYQAIARDNTDNPIVNASLQIKLAVMGDSLGSTIFWEELFNPVMTNAYGLFSVTLGQGVRQSTSTVATFSNVNWNVWPMFVRTQVYYLGAWKNMGSARLWSVPYSMVSGNIKGTLPQLSVKGTTSTMDSALFVVRNNTGQIVFAVYNEGVRIYVDDGVAKGTAKGGFAIGSFNKYKGTNSYPLFIVDPDSIRAYIDTGLVKSSRKGGFAIGSFDKSKAGVQKYFQVTNDSIRMYINDAATKAVKGGFAIGGFSTGKGQNTNYLRVTHDSTRILTADTVKGFGVSNLLSGSSFSYLRLTPSNYLIGHQAGRSITSGLYNSIMGYQAGLSINTGRSNSFIGYKAGYTNSSGNYNVFLGNETGYKNTTGSMNTFIGFISGSSNTTGSYNSFFGDSTGYHNTTGYDNTFLGARAGYNTNIGGFNTFIGAQAGYLNTSGGGNTAIGTWALFSNTSGAQNTANGFWALYSNSTGSTNTATGYAALYSNTTGYMNAANGFDALYTNSSGSYNSAIGGNALKSNTTGTCNAADGYYALKANTYGSYNTANGSYALYYNTTGYYNTASGSGALSLNTTGSNNTSVGYSAGASNSTGSGNVFIGYEAGYNETGSNKLYIDNTNTASPLIWGDFSARLLNFNGSVGVGTSTPGFILDVVGRARFRSGGGSAGFWLMNAANTSNRSFIGMYSDDYVGIYGAGGVGWGMVMNVNNGWIGIGNVSPTCKLDITSGVINLSDNYQVQWGANNMIYGNNASNFINFRTSGNDRIRIIANGNTGIGTITPGAKLEINSDASTALHLRLRDPVLNKKWDLAADAGFGDNTNDDLFFVNNAGTNAAVLTNSGSLGIGTNTPGSYKLYVAGSAYSTGGWAGSDIRWKKNILPLQPGMNSIMKLQGVRYEWRREDFPSMNFDHGFQVGLIAQEVEKVFPELVRTDDNGYKAVSYEKLSVILLEGMKEQQKQIEDYRAQLHSLQERLDKVEASLGKNN